MTQAEQFRQSHDIANPESWVEYRDKTLPFKERSYPGCSTIDLTCEAGGVDYNCGWTSSRTDWEWSVYIVFPDGSLLNESESNY